MSTELSSNHADEPEVPMPTGTPDEPDAPMPTSGTLDEPVDLSDDLGNAMLNIPNVPGFDSVHVAAVESNRAEEEGIKVLDDIIARYEEDPSLVLKDENVKQPVVELKRVAGADRQEQLRQLGEAASAQKVENERLFSAEQVRRNGLRDTLDEQKVEPSVADVTDFMKAPLQVDGDMADHLAWAKSAGVRGDMLDNKRTQIAGVKKDLKEATTRQSIAGAVAAAGADVDKVAIAVAELESVKKVLSAAPATSRKDFATKQAAMDRAQTTCIKKASEYRAALLDLQLCKDEKLESETVDVQVEKAAELLGERNAAELEGAHRLGAQVKAMLAQAQQAADAEQRDVEQLDQDCEQFGRKLQEPAHDLELRVGKILHSHIFETGEKEAQRAVKACNTEMLGLKLEFGSKRHTPQLSRKHKLDLAKKDAELRHRKQLEIDAIALCTEWKAETARYYGRIDQTKADNYPPDTKDPRYSFELPDTTIADDAASEWVEKAIPLRQPPPSPEQPEQGGDGDSSWGDIPTEASQLVAIQYDAKMAALQKKNQVIEDKMHKMEALLQALTTEKVDRKGCLPPSRR